MKYLSKGIIGLVLIFLTLGLVVISLSIISSAIKERSTQTNFRGGQERTIAVPIGKFEKSKFSLVRSKIWNTAPMDRTVHNFRNEDHI